MIEKKKNYLIILKLELEDLLEDIKLLIQQCEVEKKADCITDYVFLENLVFFKNEILGVDAFSKIIDNIDVTTYEELDSLIGDLKVKFEKEMNENGVSKAIHLSILRKMDKVKSYVER